MWDELIKRLNPNRGDELIKPQSGNNIMPVPNYGYTQRCKICNQEFAPKTDPNDPFLNIADICPMCARMIANNNIPEVLTEDAIPRLIEKKANFVEKLITYAAKKDKIKDGIVICDKCERSASLYYSQNGIPLCGKCAANDDTEDYSDIIIAA